MEFTFLHKHIKDASTCETFLMGKQWKVAELLYSKAIGKIPHNGIGQQEKRQTGACASRRGLGSGGRPHGLAPALRNELQARHPGSGTPRRGDQAPRLLGRKLDRRKIRRSLDSTCDERRALTCQEAGRTALCTSSCPLALVPKPSWADTPAPRIPRHGTGFGATWSQKGV